MVREGAAERPDNCLFGFLVGLGDQIDRVGLAGDLDTAQASQMDTAGRARGAERTPRRTARSAVSSDPPSVVPKVKGSRVESIQARSDQDCQTAPTITEVVSQRPSAPATTLARAVQDRLHKPL